MMLATLAAIALSSGPDVRTFRLRIGGSPGSRIALRATGTHGWIETFCTSKICSVGHSEAAIPSSGVVIVNFDVYRTDETSPRRARVTISSDQAPALNLDVSIR